MLRKRDWFGLLAVLGLAVIGCQQTAEKAQTPPGSEKALVAPSKEAVEKNRKESGPAGSGSGALIQFASVDHDFGQAYSGEKLSTVFTFKNIGDALLVIERVSGG